MPGRNFLFTSSFTDYAKFVSAHGWSKQKGCTVCILFVLVTRRRWSNGITNPWDLLFPQIAAVLAESMFSYDWFCRIYGSLRAICQVRFGARMIKTKKDALCASFFVLVTRRRIELLLPPWKGGVLTAWPTGRIIRPTELWSASALCW